MQLGRILLLIILLFAQVPSIAEEMDLSECKNWSTADWDHYLQQFFSPPGTGPLWRMTDEYNSVLVDGAKKACPENFSRPEIQKCTRRMKDYYEMLGKTSRFDSFSYLMSDKDYYAKQPKDKMDLPPELQSSSHGLPKNWRAVAKERGWNWILFQSTTGSPGNHESRLIMIVPQKGSTQLLLYYGRDGEKDPTKFSGLQAQVIENSKNGVELKNPIVHYRAWTFDGPQEKPQAP